MKLGKNFKIGYIDDDGRFCPLAFAQSASINNKTSSIEVSSPLTGGWVERRTKRNSWSMQHEGLLGSNTIQYTYSGKTYGFWALIKKLWTDKHIFTARWQEVLEGGATGDIMEGRCFIEDLKQVASEKSLTKVSVKFEGTGELRDLSTEDLTGAFAYSIQNHTLTLYAVTRPITSFSVHADSIAVGTWDAAAPGRTQTITSGFISAYNIISAWKGEGAAAQMQPGVTFTNSTTLHVVLLQTDERDNLQQLHRYVTPLWWGGLSMGNMTLKQGTDTVATFVTSGKTGIADRVEIDPTVDITADGTWTITTDAPQTIHCTDRTTTLARTITIYQTLASNSVNPYYVIANILPSGFECGFRLWGNSNSGTIFDWSNPTLPARSGTAGFIPDENHVHWRLTGLGADEGGPYNVQREIINDMEQHDVYYAYDSTSQRLRIWCPTQVYDTLIYSNSSSGILMGKMYNTDAQGNRVPLTLDNVSGVAGINAQWGNYHFIDVSSITVLNLSNTLTISTLPLDDIILMYNNTEVGRIPALSDPNRLYTPGAVVSVVEMATGAAQTVSMATYFQTVCVRTSATQTGESAWTLNIALRGNSDGSGGQATLPGALSVAWGNQVVTVAAGQSSATANISWNPSWVTPAATLNHVSASNFRLLTAPTPDITVANWTAYKLGSVYGYFFYDIAYLGGAHGDIVVQGSGIYNQGAATVIARGEQVARSLYRTTQSNEDAVAVSVRGKDAPEWSAMTIDHVTVNTTEKLVLSYRLVDLSSGVTVTNLTNIKDYNDSTPVYSRRSCIADILPMVGVVFHGTTDVYAQKSLLALKPGNSEAFSVTALSGTVEDDSTTDYQARFSDNENNTISVGNGLTGVEVRAVNHGAALNMI